MPSPSLLLALLVLGGAPATPAGPTAPPSPPAPPPASAVPRSLNVYDLDPGSFEFLAQQDLQALQRHTAGLRALQEQLREQLALYQQDQDIPYTPEQKRTLLTTWASFFDYFVSTEVIRQRYWNFVKVPSLTQPGKHGWGFLLTHVALTTELAHGLTYAELTNGRKQLEVLLDEPAPEYGVPARAFTQFKEKAIHIATAAQLYTGDSYREQVRPLLKKAGAHNAPLTAWAFQEMTAASQVARGKFLKRGPSFFTVAAKDLVQDSATQALFPVQRSVAEWMGDTRVLRVGKPLISREQVLAVLEKTQPGDILVARQNWYLSNIGLPGFWPHAELYVGTPAQLSAHFDGDADVKAWLATLPGQPQTLGEHLARLFPEKWAHYRGQDEHGDPFRIIESISEGVSFTGPEHGMRVDYLGVLRPRLSLREKAQAIVRAFTYQGRPYDFNFDFFSDSTLVCTELVYKAYAPAQDMKGLRIGLVDVAGRKTLPANELVKLFDQEYGLPERQLDFVAFLDGREEGQAAIEGSVLSFRQSYRRMKWDIAQK
ncbi:YiiX/YebB-like N1pC/P60 family cysteine hydrolase [Stigmatella sp. ncwal1]|uniref:YiiX/YebB-like N1pC/P60 family cysteine hydrolase n=1 Tax=Stigmatella ashevillensis TaxID=2995309 RepID=A0ABT5DL89_9BACT|nr:YiiX/YebB-like N1pC/P60 family cysteine hydrolase [Stigmatella ashevillena]MDC0714432.1 YiiX/YebB-like N1pC/P60 family cysteine hydrolase [Stigmatella ashevillena]